MLSGYGLSRPRSGNDVAPRPIARSYMSAVEGVATAGQAAVFIGYRRRDSQGFAGRLADDLIECFGRSQVFRDDDIPEGEDFAIVLGHALSACSVIVVVIGPRWLDARDGKGRRRLDNPNDWVRREIEAALARKVWLLPVLVGGAAMPDARDLPPTIAGLTRVQAVEMTDRRWDEDLKRLAAIMIRRIPVLQRSAGLAQLLGPLSSSQEWVRDYVLSRTRADDETRAGDASPGRRVLRGVLTGLKRLLVAGLLALIAWFLLENYASPEFRQGVYDFIALVSEKTGIG